MIVLQDGYEQDCDDCDYHGAGHFDCGGHRQQVQMMGIWLRDGVWRGGGH